jgi:hypothetical protein
MVLLFVGGTMNMGWIAAVAVAVAIEKLAPHGDRIAMVLGLALIAAGLARLRASGPDALFGALLQRFTSSSSTSNCSVAFGGITPPPAPFSP